MLSVQDLYVDCVAPSKPSSHPFLLIKEDAVYREVHDDDCLHKELYVHSDKSIDGIFLNKEDASLLGLTETGIVETLYGAVTRYSPLHISFLSHSHSLPVSNVYALPPQFAGTHLADGIIGISLLFALGVSVAYDRGFVYLVRNGFEPLIAGGNKPEEEGPVVEKMIAAEMVKGVMGLAIFEEEEGSEEMGSESD
ncbi:hypothetical protein HDU98_010751 [Podochytrium sp. JEL0797]|nr:hypothetical protein HDU98_010751 [Podochytrium sp. JEL0797]